VIGTYDRPGDGKHPLVIAAPNALLRAASPTELSDLLSFARVPDTRLVNEVLSGSTLSFEIVEGDHIVGDETEGRLIPRSGAPAPAAIDVITNLGVAGTIKPADHDDVDLLIGMGVPLTISVAPSAVGPTVSVTLASEADEI
jgi:hypothetical protein